MKKQKSQQSKTNTKGKIRKWKNETSKNQTETKHERIWKSKTKKETKHPKVKKSKSQKRKESKTIIKK